MELDIIFGYPQDQSFSISERVSSANLCKDLCIINGLSAYVPLGCELDSGFTDVPCGSGIRQSDL